MADIADYITADGYQTVLDEYEHLWKTERPRVTHEVSVAAAHGDRSENAEYQYGKKRLREIDGRLGYLRKRLEKLTIVRPEEGQAGRVFFGAKVTLEDEDGEECRYQIVGADESDADNGRISVTSPVGKALLGKKLDDEVVVRVPRGKVNYTVLEIEYDVE